MLNKIRNNKSLFTIFLIVFIDLFGFGIILPLLPFIGEKYGANPFQIGLLAATYSLFQLISTPILGRLSDRFGRKKLLIISQIGSMFGYILLGLANALPLIFISRLIDGITGGNISIAQAYIADVTTKENRAKGMGLIGAAFGLGFIIGPAVGGLLSHFGFWAPAFAAAFISLITIISTFFFLPETVNTEEAAKNPKRQFKISDFVDVMKIHPLGLLIFVFFVLNFAFSVMQGNFSLWTERAFNFGPTENGLMFAYIGVLSVIMQIKILPFLLKKEKGNETKLLKIAVLVLSVSLFAFVFVIHPILMLIPLTLMPFGNGLSNPLIQSIASEDVPKEDYGETLGILQSAGSFGRIFGPIAGGWMFGAFNKDVPFVIAAGVVLLTFFLLQKKLK
jgi:MFS transporter, DHA1 family, tetracycline resistance protein